MNRFEERQRGLIGSVILFQGSSGSGKSHAATELWLRAGMLFGGICYALAPVADIFANVASYKLGYQKDIDSRRGRGWNTRNEVKAIDFLNSQVFVTDDPTKLFAMIREDMANDPGDGSPQFSLLIDEGALARKESPILESIGPIARNLRGVVYVTGHRSMAVPPAIRAVLRARFLWYSSDGTGEEALEKVIADTPGFKYSPTMGAVEKEERFYRGFRYTPTGPVPFEFNPYLQGFPDWALFPALPTKVAPRKLISG